MPTWLTVVCVLVGGGLIVWLIQSAIEKGLNKGEKRVNRSKAQKDYASEDTLTGNTWRFQAGASVSDVWRKLQQYVITGEAEKGKLYVVSAHENKIVWALRLKGTTVGFTAQMDMEQTGAGITAMFSFTEWSFSSGGLPFLNEMRILLQSIKTAFQSADKNFTVTQIRKVS